MFGTPDKNQMNVFFFFYPAKKTHFRLYFVDVTWHEVI